VALIGHSYIVHDAFLNMNIVDKLRTLGIGVVTSESVSEQDMILETDNLFKTPFWYYAREYYGSAVSLYKHGAIDGIIYLSTFSCGIDSIFTELVKQDIGATAFMVLKLDEHTGEAAVDTRIEAFTDMLKRRAQNGHHISTNGQHMPCRQGVL
jgi:predicted nucleotide-binding protein (sugar kinase/HSP70/actin superfamily)